MKRRFTLFLLLLAGFPAGICRADTFGTGANSFDIDFVTIGQRGNPPDDDPNPAGAVDYVYRIGKYEIPEDAIRKANAQSALDGAPLEITLDTRGPDKPATSITWFEAAQFVNWLNTSTGSVPAYKFDSLGEFQLWLPTDPGYNPQNLYRNKLAHYFLPSVDEWHKAAYYDPVAGHYWDYPTGSDAIPDGIDFVGDPNFDAVFYDGASNPEPNDIMNVGLLSLFGTAGLGGNVAEWHESEFDRTNDMLGSTQRSSGGSTWTGSYSVLAAWNSGIGTAPQFVSDRFGFRVANRVPEPTTFVPATIGTLIVLVIGRVKRTIRSSI